MAGAMRKLGEYLGLVESADDRADRDDRDEDYYETYDSYDAYEAPRNVRTARPESRGEPERSFGARGAATLDRPARVDAYRADRAEDDYADEGYRITTLQPRTYNEARTIGEHFRAGTPVIMNLTDMDDVDAKRLVDFAAGLIFGLRGSIERVTNKVFLLSPEHVVVTAEDKARIAQSGFFNQS